jgi:uncharacterized protein
VAALLLFAVALPAAALVRLPPPEDRSIHDFAGVLSPDTVRVLEARHAELFQKTGVALVIVTIRDEEGEPLGDFAVRVAKEWGVGKKGKDRGIVVAITTGEPHIFVATGYGVEGYLPDGRVGGILDRYVVGPLRSRDFDSAVQMVSSALTQASAQEFGVTIGGTPEASSGAPVRRRVSAVRVIFQLILALIVLFILFRNPSLLWLLLLSGRGGRGGFRGGGFGGGGFSGGGFGGSGGFGGFGGGGFGGGGAGR